MTVLLGEMTRDQIKAVAPGSVAILPTAAIEQHGPHLPVMTDTLLCGTVAERSALRASENMRSENVNVVVAPVLCYGNSHHHRPFAGVLSLTSHTFMAAVTEVLEGLMLSGFRKLVILNGHGGNTDSNAVVGLDFVNRLQHPVTVATAAYWDIARDAIVGQGIVPTDRIPGHAGCFECAMVMALRPDLVNQSGLAQTKDVSQSAGGIFGALAGGTIQTYGAWAAGDGYTDVPAMATPEQGEALLEVITEQVANFLVAFAQIPE